MQEHRDYLSDEVVVSERPTVPDGTYVATLLGVREETHPEFGDRWVWDWSLPAMGPDGDDFELRVWSPPRISNSGIAAEMARALGVDTSKGSRVRLGDLRGRSAMLSVILDTEKGRNRVRAATPAPPAAAPVATALDPEYQAFLAAKAARQAAEQEAHALAGRPASEAERVALDADAPTPDAA